MMTDINDELETSDSQQAIHSMGRAFRSKNYRLFFGGQGISLIGTWIHMIALNWLVYRLTKSAFMLGLVGFISQIPMLLLTPLAGVLADRWNRYRTLIYVQSLLMIYAALLSLLVFFDWAAIWNIILLGVLVGSTNSLEAPTRHSFIIQLVENRDDLPNAIALNAAMFNSARLIGPAIAGFIIAWVGEGVCFLLNAISYMAVIAALLMMKIPRQTTISTEKEGIFQELKEGFRYTFGSIPIRLSLFHFAFVALVGMSVSVLMPILATQILHGGAKTLGFLMGAMGFGALVGSIYMASRKKKDGLRKITVISSSIFGAGLIVLSLSKSYVLSVGLMPIIGLGMVTIMTGTNIFVQMHIEDSKRARVMAFYLLAFFGTVPLGNLIIGTIAHHIGVPYTIMFSGISSLLCSIIYAWRHSVHK